jgi:hypothetical protein
MFVFLVIGSILALRCGRKKSFLIVAAQNIRPAGGCIQTLFLIVGNVTGANHRIGAFEHI